MDPNFIEVIKKGEIDFEGQRLALLIQRVLVISFGIVGFLIGLVKESFIITSYSVLAGTILAFFLTIPPWDMYRKNLIKWAPSRGLAKEEEERMKEDSDDE